MSKLLELQTTMFLLIFVGAILKKAHIVGNEGQKNITDIVIYLVLPCNIIQSFLVKFTSEIWRSFISIFVISILIQIFASWFGRIFYRSASPEKRTSLQYGIICSNAGFLGNPVAQGVFGITGLTLASIYLIPQRIMMWSSGVALFSGNHDRKVVLKKVLTHPCILACEIGLVLMLFQISIPHILDAPISAVSACNMPLSMMVIGMILAEMDLKTLVDKDVVIYSIIRLVIIPAVVYAGCLLFHVKGIVMGVSVILAAMPAGATTSILAAKYEADEKFATKLVIFSTLLSLATTLIWSLILT